MAVPAIPSSFIVQQANGQVWITWDATAGATGYKVQKSTDGSTFSLLASPVVNQYLDTTVTVGTQYWYKVCATNGSGDSGYTTAQSIVPTQPGGMSLGQIRLLAQQRADRQNSQFVGTSEWNQYINQSAFELYDLLTTLYEDYYLAPITMFQTNGSQQFYDLPDGTNSFLNASGASFTPRPFYKLLGVDCGVALNNNAWITLKKFNFITRNRYIFPNVASSYLGVFNLQYRLMGNQIEFIPTPSGGQYIRLWYIPRMVELLKDTDILDGVSGWTEYIIVDAAIKALQKEESDTSVLMAQKQGLIDRIQASAMNRDAGQSDTVSDTRSWGNRFGNYGGPGFDGSFGGY